MAAWELDMYHCTFSVEHPELYREYKLSGILRCHLCEWKRLSGAWDILRHAALTTDGFVSDEDTCVELDRESLILGLESARKSMLQTLNCTEEDVDAWSSQQLEDYIPEALADALYQNKLGNDYTLYEDIKNVLEFIDEALRIAKYYPQLHNSYYLFKNVCWS